MAIPAGTDAVIYIVSGITALSFSKDMVGMKDFVGTATDATFIRIPLSYYLRPQLIAFLDKSLPLCQLRDFLDFEWFAFKHGLFHFIPP
jgi:hypothetical protein